jgi:hypothetical protein
MGQEEDKELHYTLSDMVGTMMCRLGLGLAHQESHLVKVL